MARRALEDIARYINPAVETTSFPGAWNTLGPREWKRTLTWLDHSGLALYFLDRVEAEGVTPFVPGELLAQLQLRKSSNERRIERLKQMFAAINDGFQKAGVRYAAVKGFSLIPQYCANPYCRSISDLDYLVERDSIEAAQRVLVELGYVLKKSEGEEFSFWIPAAEPVGTTQQYSPDGPWMVELHLSMWDQGLFRVPLKLPESCLAETNVHEWEGLRFTCLPDHFVFVGQILHAFKHVLDGWVRLSWLFEIGHFLQNHRDRGFWNQVDVMVSEEPSLGDFIAFISHLASDLFGFSPSSAIRAYASRLPIPVRIWLRDYAHEWLFQKLPRYELSTLSPSKLVLFLRERYATAPGATENRKRSLFPWRRVGHLLEAGGTRVTWRSFSYKVRWLSVHVIYHIGANLRYLWELPKWRYRIRRRNSTDLPTSLCDARVGR